MKDKRGCATGCLWAAFVGAIVWVGGAWVLHRDLITFAVFSAPVLIIAAIIASYCIRAILAEGSYRVEIELSPDGVVMGAKSRCRVLVWPLRPLRLGRAVLVLRCEERAITRGSSDTTRSQVLFEREFPLWEGRRAGPGETLEAVQEIAIPADIPPSFSGENNSIRWALILRTPVAGWIPDIRQELPFVVLPRIAPGGDRSGSVSADLPGGWLERSAADAAEVRRGVLVASLEQIGGPVWRGGPVVTIGGTQRVTVALRAEGPVNCRGIHLWVGCRIHGSGTPEKVELAADRVVHQGALAAGQIVREQVNLDVSGAVPVSFAGRYVKCDWVIRLRADIPVLRDPVLDLPFIVLPRLLSDADGRR